MGKKGRKKGKGVVRIVNQNIILLSLSSDFKFNIRTVREVRFVVLYCILFLFLFQCTDVDCVGSADVADMYIPVYMLFIALTAL